jgi:hypothetical protein
MKKLIIFSMMLLSIIVSSITIQANELIIPQADINLRTMNYSYSTTVQDEILYLSTKLPTDIAIWYVVNSGWLNQPTDRDTLRFHIFNIKPLLDIVELLEYNQYCYFQEWQIIKFIHF